MSSKLGAGIYQNTDEAIQAGLAFPGPLLLYETALDAARDIRATTPNRLIIGRLWVDDDQEGWLKSIEPAEYGRALANRLLYHPANPYVDGWQSLNEINDPELRKAQAQFDYAFALIMLQARKQAVIGNFAVGNFDSTEILEWRMAFHVPNVMLGYHAYWPQEGPEFLGQWLAFRYRLWADYCRERFIKFPPIFLNEYGVDLWNPEKNNGRGGFEGKGWKEALGGNEAEYVRQLCLFRDIIEADPLVLGATIFCCGDSGGWDSFNVAGSRIPMELREGSLEGQDNPLEIGGGVMGYREEYPEAYQAWDEAGGPESNFLAWWAVQKALRGEMLAPEEAQAIKDRRDSADAEWFLSRHRFPK